MITALLPSSAKAWVQAGRLDCRSAGGVTFVVGAVVQFRCMFYPVYGGRPNRYYATIQRLGVDLGYNTGVGLGWSVFAPTTYIGPRRPCRELWRCPGQCELGCRGRRQCAGRRLHQHVRAAAVQRTGPGRHQCFRRHRRADARPGAPLKQYTRFAATRLARSPGHAGAFVGSFVTSLCAERPSSGWNRFFARRRSRRRGVVPRVAYPSKSALANAPIRLKR